MMSDDRLEMYRSGSKVAIKGSTWVFKGVSKDLFQDEFDSNPVKARRDYGAEPPEGSGNAIPMPELIDTYSNKGREDPVDSSLNRLGWVVPPIFEWFVGDPRFNYYLHFDLSKSGDQTGLGLVHYDHYTNMYAADLIMKIPVSKDWNLKFKSIEILVDFLIGRGFYLATVSFDGFQSLQIIQNLTAKGINALQFSVDRSPEAYDTLISTILQNRFDYYYHYTFCEELKAIQIVGNKYDHPSGGSKDVSDGVAGSLANCVRASTAVAFNREDLSDVFIDSEMVFEDGFVIDKETGAVEITNLHAIRYGNLSSFYIDSYEDVVLVLRGYLENRVFFLDYVELFDLGTPNLYDILLNLISAFKPAFVGLGRSVSFHIVDMLREARIRAVSADTGRLDTASNKNIRVVRQNLRETIETLVAQIKQKSFKVVDRLTIFNQLSELNYNNYQNKLLAVSMGAWLHYMLQETKRSLGKMPRPVLGGENVSYSVRTPSVPNARQGGRPKPKFR